jgi:predicted aspartyl protease
MGTRQRFSRRQFLQIGTSSLAFASVARARGRHLSGWNHCAYSSSPADVPAPITAATDTANRLTVPVRINGQGPYRFIVDTGADRTVVATEVGVELGLLRGERVVLDGVVQAVLTDTVSIRELAFGSIASRNLKVPTLPRSLLDADGYLGLDFLDGHRVTFDFKGGLLQVSDPRPKFSADWVRHSEARVRTFGSSGHLRSLDCKVDGVPAAAFIDSGAEVSAANAPLLAALAHRNPSFGEIGNIELIDITGGQIQGKVAMVKQIRLPGLAFDDCPLVIANFQVFKAWGLLRSPALLIGMNLLRQFSKVSIDYGLKELRFDLEAFSVRQIDQNSIA